LASIGMAETVHAAARGENITIIFINNAIYGIRADKWRRRRLSVKNRRRASRAERASFRAVL
jgi:hypothetical protein